MATVAFALGIFARTPTSLLADTLMPWVFVTVPMMLVGLIPIVLIEALVLWWMSAPGWRQALRVSAAANLVSTLVGVAGMLLAQFTPLAEVGTERNAVVLFVPLFFLSWLIEDPIAWRMLRPGRPGSAVPPGAPAPAGSEPPPPSSAFPAPTRSRVRSGTFAANVASYLFLAAALVMLEAQAVSEKMDRMAGPSSVGSLRTINTACVTYSTTYGIGFPSTLAELGTSGAVSSTSAQLIDNVLAGGAKSGYTFTYVAGAPLGGLIPSYTVNADPISRGTKGQRHFFTDQSGVIRYNASAKATVSDSPLQ